MALNFFKGNPPFQVTMKERRAIQVLWANAIRGFESNRQRFGFQAGQFWSSISVRLGFQRWFWVDDQDLDLFLIQIIQFRLNSTNIWLNNLLKIEKVNLNIEKVNLYWKVNLFVDFRSILIYFRLKSIDFELFHLFFSCCNQFSRDYLDFNDSFRSEMLLKWWFKSDFKQNLAQGPSNCISLKFCNKKFA